MIGQLKFIENIGKWRKELWTREKIRKSGALCKAGAGREVYEEQYKRICQNWAGSSFALSLMRDGTG